MFTPQEVSEKSFPKAPFGAGGYAMTSVDEFLDALTEDYASLYKENTALKAKLKVLAEKVEEYRATEDAMRSTLLAAQKMAAKLVQDAQTESAALLEEAHRQHAKALSELAQEKADAEKKLLMAQESLADFIQKSGEMCRQQSAFLDALPQMELPKPAAPAAEPRAAVEDVEQNILETISAITDTETAQELHADETDVLPFPEPELEMDADTDSAAIPSDFKLSLDELKFGRNYDSK